MNTCLKFTFQEQVNTMQRKVTYIQVKLKEEHRPTGFDQRICNMDTGFYPVEYFYPTIIGQVKSQDKWRASYISLPIREVLPPILQRNNYMR